MWQRQVTALRPLGVGERIDVAIKIVRRSFLTFAKAALAIAIPSAVVVVLIILTLVSSFRSLFTSVNPQGDNLTGTPRPSGGALATLFGGVLALEIFSFLVITLITAVAFRIVSNAYLGQPTGWRQALVFGLKRLHSVIWVQFLIAVALLVADLAASLLSAGLRAAHAGGVGLAIIFVLELGLFVGAIWFGVATSLSTPTVMLEDARGTKAIRRSLSLCRGNWWTTFGTLVLTYVLSYIAVIVLVVLAFFVGAILGKNPVLLFIEFGVVALIYFVVISSFFSAVLVVISIDLRVRKEGFDIQHLASQMGATPTSAALSFMPPARGPAWGYGVPGGPAWPGYGGGGPPPPGWQQGGGPQQPWGQPQQQPWGQCPQQPWGQPQQQPWGQPPQQPWGQGPQQPWGQPPQQPWGQGPQPGPPQGAPPGWPQPGPPQGAPPGWPQPSPVPAQPWGRPQQAAPAERPPPGLPPNAPLISTEGAPLRPLPPFRPGDARPAATPPAVGSPEPPPPQAPPADPEPDW